LFVSLLLKSAAKITNNLPSGFYWQNVIFLQIVW
jgi:hypothetical protein